jgi:hypothetical protein
LDKCPQLENYILAIAFLPLWFRLAQCFRRYHDAKIKSQLWNAGKYFSSILIQFANIFKHKIKNDLTLQIFIGVSIIATCYSYYWDLYMDWGLLRSTKSGKWGIRDKFLLPAWFYYYAVVSNLFLRFFWILPLLSVFMPGWILNTQLLIVTICFAELFRRAQWAIIRLENEQINNLEKYRTFLEIPAVREDESEAK